MRGPEHYAMAMQLLNQADDVESDNIDLIPMLLTALVHAVLAQAAATALSTVPPDGHTAQEWSAAIAVRPVGARS